MGKLGKLVLVTLAIVGVAGAWQVPQVPCFFIFGDSLVDNGNNNGILTLARANYRPYGIDFPQGASGRFTNGRTMADVLGQLLGFRSFIPPYAVARGDEALRGLNYASGAAGIRRETGDNLGEHYDFSEQINHFGNSVLLMKKMFRGNTTSLRAHLSKCIYFVGMGSNDYLNNYFMPYYYPTSYEFSPTTYAALLIQDYTRQLQELYNLGARKVVVVGIGQVGCTPYELARNNNNGYSRRNNSQCNERIDEAISIFNNGLVRMVDGFNGEHLEAKFIYVNIFDSSKEIAENAASYGFKVTDRGCCGVGRNNGQITCLPYQTPCPDRTKFLFWDAFHPTELANVIFARKAYYSRSQTIAHPMNVQQLARA